LDKCRIYSGKWKAFLMKNKNLKLFSTKSNFAGSFINEYIRGFKKHGIMNIKCSIFFLFFLIIFQNNTNAQPGVDHWETVVFAEDIWSYRLGTSEPPSSWMQSNFNDNSWSTGPGGFGYGDNDDNTTIPTTLSLYIRIDFNILDTSKIEMAVLHADYDDAFVAYLNGQEFGRGNFENGGSPPAFNDTPMTDHEAALYNGELPEEFPIYADNFDDLIKEGQNTLAIQIHNVQINSSDLSSNFFFSLGIKDNSNDYEEVPSWFFAPFVPFDFISSNLPIIKINTNGQTIVDEPRIVADMEVIDNGPGNLNYLTDPANDYNGKIAIEIRGASSLGFPKSNYGFETQDELGENNNYPLLGFPEENDWILHGPYSDKSLIRNALTFDIGRKMMDYASRTRFCELFINDEYRGLYLMMERIKRDAARVDIATLNPDDIEGDELTGGYVFQLDRDNENTEEDGWYSPYASNPFYAFHSPDYDDLLPVQKDYLRNWMNDFELAMLQANYSSIYNNYIDVESFVNYFIINELTKHIDAFKLSMYMYKKKDSNGGKLFMGPIWDFNLGYANFNFACDPEPEEWIYPCTSRAFWLNRMLTIPDVQNRIRCRWNELRETVLHTDTLMNTIDQMTAEIDEAKDRNFYRWDILGIEIWPNYFIGDTHEQEIDFLKNWLSQRINWMDQNMLGVPTDCIILGQETIENNILLNSYPNPFENQINFSFENNNFEKGQLQIFDAFGNEVLKHILQANEIFTWKTGGLPSGVYFYELKVGENLAVGKILRL
jgi:CotH protein/type IX secretion system substrate protein